MEITGPQTDLAPRIQWLEKTSSHETKYTSSDDFFTEHAVRVYTRARARVRVYFSENFVYTHKDEFSHVQCLKESLYMHLYTFTAC